MEAHNVERALWGGRGFEMFGCAPALSFGRTLLCTWGPLFSRGAPSDLPSPQEVCSECSPTWQPRTLVASRAPEPHRKESVGALTVAWATL